MINFKGLSNYFKLFFFKNFTLIYGLGLLLVFCILNLCLNFDLVQYLNIDEVDPHAKIAHWFYNDVYQANIRILKNWYVQNGRSFNGLLNEVYEVGIQVMDFEHYKICLEFNLRYNINNDITKYHRLTMEELYDKLNSERNIHEYILQQFELSYRIFLKNRDFMIVGNNKKLIVKVINDFSRLYVLFRIPPKKR